MCAVSPSKLIDTGSALRTDVVMTTVKVRSAAHSRSRRKRYTQSANRTRTSVSCSWHRLRWTSSPQCSCAYKLSSTTKLTFLPRVRAYRPPEQSGMLLCARLTVKPIIITTIDNATWQARAHRYAALHGRVALRPPKHHHGAAFSLSWSALRITACRTHHRDSVHELSTRALPYSVKLVIVLSKFRPSLLRSRCTRCHALLPARISLGR